MQNKLHKIQVPSDMMNLLNQYGIKTVSDLQFVFRETGDTRLLPLFNMMAVIIPDVGY